MESVLFEKITRYLSENYIDPNSEKGKIDIIIQGVNPFARKSINKCSLQPLQDSIEKIRVRIIRNEKEFNERLLYYINLKKETNPSTYNKAGITSDCFSKIKRGKTRTPKKETIIALALVLELSVEELVDLLASAGYALNPYNRADIIYKFCFEEKIYNIDDVNEVLVKFNLNPIGGVL